jgi:hypothetical protein
LFAAATLIKLLALLATGFIFIWLFPRKIESVITAAKTRTWPNFGIGVLALVATPVVAILLMITVIGFYIGIILMLAYILMLVLASVLLLSFVPFVGWLAVFMIFCITLGSLVLWFRQTSLT